MAAGSDSADGSLRLLQLQAIDSSHRQIRLLKVLPPDPDNDGDSPPLRCELKTVSLNTAPPPKYTALSYAWGDASHGRHEIVINDALAIVTANLYQALLALRAHRGRQTVPLAAAWLWIDAVCINQADLAERNAQVAIMRDIYRDAARVLIWIGPGDADSDALIDWWVTPRGGHDDGSCRSEGGDGDIARHDPDLQTDLMSIQDHFRRDAILSRNILARPWFTRKWVLQELVLACADPLVVCGTRELSWTRLTDGFEDTFHPRMPGHPDAYARWMKARASTSLFGEPSGEVVSGRSGRRGRNSSRKLAINSFLLAKDLRLEYARGGARLSLPKLLVRAGFRAASDARDQVYGVLGMLRARDAHLVSVDYAAKSADQVMREAFEAAWRTDADDADDFWSLMCIWDRWGQRQGPQSQDRQQQALRDSESLLPSWATDLNYGGRHDDDLLFEISPHTGCYLGGTTWRWRRRLPVDFIPGSTDDGAPKVLCLQGYRLDTILHADPADLPSKHTIRTTTSRDAFLRLLQRIEHASAQGTATSIPATSPLAALADLRALQPIQRLFGGDGKHDDALWEIALGRAPVPDEYRRDDPLRIADPEYFRATYVENLLSDIWTVCSDRKIVRTRYGFVGVATPPVCVGDVVALVPGMQCPYVLRPVEGRETFRLVGFAGVAGVALFDQLDVCLERSGMEMETLKIV